MKLGLFLLLICLKSQIVVNAESEEDGLIVQTSLGPIQGFKYTSSWTKKPIYAFRGIPFAAPPVGDLRFKDPVLPESWTAVKNCTEDGPSCLQNSDFIIGYRNITFEMSEDCLYLNVHSPLMPKEDSLLPVMVWVHGGGFIEGSGSYFRYGPDHLVGEGVIVVTLNYRLGALGFLTLGTPEVPGNSAMKDQMFALCWVQREIRKFGGDPEKVTLFGESAGSASVHLQYLSPLSKGLFQGVIGESGAALGEWSTRANAPVIGKRLAKLVNCTSEDVNLIGKCLREVPAAAIVAAQVKVTAEDGGSATNLLFVPIIDKNTSSNPFLPETPAELIEHKHGSLVPFIMGINSDEGMMMLRGKEQIRNITNNLDSMIPYNVKKQCTPERLKVLIQRMKDFYFKEPPSEYNLRGYIDMFTDQMFGYSTAVSAKAYRHRAPVYLYYFAFNGKFKEIWGQMYEKIYNTTGVSHAEEMNYIFERAKVNQEADDDSNEMITWRRMVRMWTNFAKFGTPTVGKDPVLQDVTWEPVSNTTTKYLLINNTLEMIDSDFLAARVALWDSLTPSESSYLQVTNVLVVAAVSLALTLHMMQQKM